MNRSCFSLSSCYVSNQGNAERHSLPAGCNPKTESAPTQRSERTSWTHPPQKPFRSLTRPHCALLTRKAIWLLFRIPAAFAQPCRLTMKLIQIGAKGDVQPFDTG